MFDYFGLEFPTWILLNMNLLSAYPSFIYSTKMYLVSAIIRTGLGARDIVTIKAIPTLMELLISL